VVEDKNTRAKELAERILARMKEYGHITGEDEDFLRNRVILTLEKPVKFGRTTKIRSIAIASVYLAFRELGKEYPRVECLNRCSGGYSHTIGTQNYFEDYFGPITNVTIRNVCRRLKSQKL
jgi:hypothetical protein